MPRRGRPRKNHSIYSFRDLVEYNSDSELAENFRDRSPNRQHAVQSPDPREEARTANQQPREIQRQQEIRSTQHETRSTQHETRSTQQEPSGEILGMQEQLPSSIEVPVQEASSGQLPSQDSIPLLQQQQREDILHAPHVSQTFFNFFPVV